MRFWVNGKELAEQPDAGLAMDAQLKTIGMKLYETGNLIVKVEADGQDVTGRPFDSWGLDAVPERIELSTQRPEELLASSVRVSREWLGPLGTELRNCADRFRMGEEAQAIENLLKAIDGLQLLMAGVGQIEKLSMGIKRETGMASLRSFQDALSKLLDEVIESQENRDWILLADLLEYDVLECLEGWEKNTTEILATLS